MPEGMLTAARQAAGEWGSKSTDSPLVEYIVAAALRWLSERLIRLCLIEQQALAMVKEKRGSRLGNDSYEWVLLGSRRMAAPHVPCSPSRRYRKTCSSTPPGTWRSPQTL